MLRRAVRPGPGSRTQPGGGTGLGAPRRRRRRRSRCATRWCVRRSTRPRPGQDRRRAHRALAEALAGSGDPDREAWHRASAADGPDPEVVDALELVGITGAATRRVRRRTRGVRTSRGALPTTRRSVPRLTFAAARSAWACGQAGQAQALLSAAREEASDPLLLCDIARLRGHIEVNLGSATEAHRIFVEAAQAVHPFDPARALDIGVAAAVMRTFGADSGTAAAVRRRSWSAATAGRPAADAVPAAHAGRDDPGGRGRLVRRRGRPWTWRWRSASRSTTATCCGTSPTRPSSSGDDQAQQHFYALRPVAGTRGRCGDGRRLLPAAAVLRPLPRRRPRRGAQQRRGGHRARRRASASRR